MWRFNVVSGKLVKKLEIGIPIKESWTTNPPIIFQLSLFDGHLESPTLDVPSDNQLGSANSIVTRG